MNRLLKELPRVAIPLAVLAVGIAGFAAIGQRTPPEQDDEARAEAPLVETVPAEAVSDALVVETDGVAVPFREVTLAAEVAGRITNKCEECRTGRFVEEPTQLFEIDPTDYRIEVERLTHELEQVELDLAELDVEIAKTKRLAALAKREMDLAQAELDRIRRLTRSGASTDAARDSAERARLKAENSWETLEKQVEVLQAQRKQLDETTRKLAERKLERAQADLDRTQVAMPFDGVVVDDPVEEGEHVQPGTPLVTIEDTSAVEVRCSLTMDELRWVTRSAEFDGSRGSLYALPKTPVEVTYRLGSHEYAWPGHLDRVEGIGLNEKTRTVPVRVRVPDPRTRIVDGSTGTPLDGGPRALVRGMFVTVHIETPETNTLLRVPELAVRLGQTSRSRLANESEATVVWAWQGASPDAPAEPKDSDSDIESGRLAVVPVRIVRRSLDGPDDETPHVLVEPLGGTLSAGTAIVTSPLVNVKDGMAVRREKP